jgi:hypothetical protein
MKTLIREPWQSAAQAFRDAWQAFGSLIDAGGMRALIVMMLSTIVFWHIYTPIHELLHVAACLMTGGTVTELALPVRYGGALLQPIFPFIVTESDYAGQLTGFTVPNDFAYAFVDYLPYVLSLPGILLMIIAGRRQWSWLFGAAMVLAFVPLVSITGDYYEAASLLTTRLSDILGTGLEPSALVSDDLLNSVKELAEAGQLSFTVLLLLILGLLLAIYTAVWTVALQAKISNFFSPQNEAGTRKPA